MFVPLLAGAAKLLKYAPVVVKAIRGCINLVKQIRADVNPDVTLRADVRDRIAHVNVFILSLANAGGVQVTIPSVTTPQDFPTWSAFVAEFIQSFMNEQMIPNFSVPIAKLLFTYPNPTPKNALILSDLGGFNSSVIRPKIDAETDPVIKASMTDALNAITSFLNRYQSAFTAWEEEFEKAASVAGNVDSTTGTALAENFYAKHSFQKMYESALHAFFRGNPYQTISDTGSLFIPNPVEWSQTSTDDYHVSGNIQILSDINTDTGVLGPTNNVWRRLTQSTGGPLNVIDRFFDNSLKLTETSTVVGGPTLPDNEGTLAVIMKDQSEFLAKVHAMTATQVFDNLHFAEITLSAYNEVPNSIGIHAVEQNLTVGQLPKTDSYEWYLRTRLSVSPGYFRDFPATFAVRVIALFQRFDLVGAPYEASDLGAIEWDGANPNYRPMYHKVLDIPLSLKPPLTANANVIVKPKLYVQLTGQGGAADITTDGYIRCLTYASNTNIKRFSLSLDAQEAIGFIRPGPVPATLLTYRTFDNPNARQVASGEVTFFNFLGMLLKTTGDDPNLSVSAVWLSRLSNSGIDLNVMFRWIVSASRRLGASAERKYELLGIPLANLINVQEWIFVDGPFFNKATGQRFPDSVIETALGYLWSDLQVAAAYLTQTTEGTDALIAVRGK